MPKILCALLQVVGLEFVSILRCTLTFSSQCVTDGWAVLDILARRSISYLFIFFSVSMPEPDRNIKKKGERGRRRIVNWGAESEKLCSAGVRRGELLPPL